MVALNVSLDDSSPLITYSGLWLDTPASDSLAANYSGASLHTSSVAGATVSFVFNGTGVWLYGGHRPGYGNYSLSVDGHAISNGSSFTPVPLFDQLLGGAGDMSIGQHIAVLSNIGGGPIDLDSLVFETHMGADDQHVNTTTVDDSDSRITYLPSPSAWQISSRDFFANRTVHYTNTTGAQATFKFSGDAIAVYGGVSFDHGPFTVSVDGQTRQLNGGGQREYHAQTLLYFAQGFGQGDHNLTLTANSGYLDLDSLVTYSAAGGHDDNATSTAGGAPSGGMEGMNLPDSAGNGSHVNAAPTQGNNSNAADAAAADTKSIPKTVLAAIIAVSLLGLVALVLIVAFVARRVQKRRAQTALVQSRGYEQDHSPTFLQNPDVEAGAVEKSDRSLQRSRSSRRFTMRSIASMWSQASFHGQPPDIEAPPPVPAVPAGLSMLAVPVPRSERTMSISSLRTGSATLRSLDVFDDEKQAFGVANDDGSNYRVSIGSNSTATVAPPRPKRPPGLDLSDLEHVPL